MRTRRRHLRRVAASWLVLQLLVTVWVPVALYAVSTSDSHAEECTCDHPSGGICPMHRHSTSSSSSSSTACSLRSALDPLDALVASLMGPVGALPGVVVALDTPVTSDRLPRMESTPLDRVDSPDSPPPRA